MRRFHVVLLLLLLVFVTALVAVAVLVSRYSSDKKKLLAARDEVLPKLQAIMEEMEKEKRPVLRGEPIPGSGAEKLDLVLGKTTDVPMPWPEWWKRLFRAMYEGTLDPEQAEIARAHIESIGAFLPEAREALQHESCYLSEDLTRGFDVILVRDSRQRDQVGIRLAVGWLLEAKELAGAGRRGEALRCLTDTIRLGEELGPRGRLPFKRWVREDIQGAAAIVGLGLLWSYPFETEELDVLLGELSILEESQANLRGTLEVIEFQNVITEANAWEKGRTVLGPRDLGWWGQYARGGFDVVEFRKRFDEQRKLYLEPIQKMLQARVGALSSEEGSALVEIGAIGIRVDELQALARLRCLRAAAMVHRHRSAHAGKWPEALRDCGQEPIDPWDGKPLRYKPPEGGRPAYIYSVGPDLMDDGGMAEQPFQSVRTNLRSEGGIAAQPLRWGPNGGRAHYDFIFPLGRWPSAEAPGDTPR